MVSWYSDGHVLICVRGDEVMGHKEKMVGGLEFDALAGWQRVLHWRAGQRKWIKRKFNRRIRKKWRYGLHRITRDN